jgi:CelD/BcsL family acetyltransferase involved in cellulose biosynthesis
MPVITERGPVRPDVDDPAARPAGAADRSSRTRVPSHARCELVQAETVEADWRRLAAEDASVFSTWEWADAWWNARGDGRPRRILAIRADDGDIIGIVPLYREQVGPARVLRFIGDGASDALGPICHPTSRTAVAVALREHLDATDDWDLLIGRTMPLEAAWGKRLGALRLNRESSARLMLNGSWDDYLASRSSRFRQRTRAAERKLRQRHGLRRRYVTDPDELPRATDRLFELHQLQRAGRPSSFLSVGGFHRDVMRRALDAGWLRLCLVELEGDIGAASLEYAYEGVVHGYQMGIDTRWRKVLDVRTMVSMSLRDAFEDGRFREFRIGRGGEDYKRGFTSDDPGVETVVLGRGVVGRPLALAMHRARGVRPLLRSFQVRLGR